MKQLLLESKEDPQSSEGKKEIKTIEDVEEILNPPNPGPDKVMEVNVTVASVTLKVRFFCSKKKIYLFEIENKLKINLNKFSSFMEIPKQRIVMDSFFQLIVHLFHFKVIFT